MRQPVSLARCGLTLTIAALMGACAINTTTVSTTAVSTTAVSTMTASESVGTTGDRVTALFQNDPEFVTADDAAIALARLTIPGAIAPSDLAAAATTLQADLQGQDAVTLDIVPDESAFDFAAPQETLDLTDVAAIAAAISSEADDVDSFETEVGRLLGRAPNATPDIVRIPGRALPTPTPSPSFPAAVNIVFEGKHPLNGGEQGSVAYPSVFDPPGITPAPFRADGSQMEAHPFDGLAISGIYTTLSSRDLYDRVSGAELDITQAASPFGASSSASPHGLEPLGITGRLHLSWVGADLDFQNPERYFFEGDRGTPALKETRIYTGGTMRLLEETSPGNVRLITEYDNLTIQFVIHWDERGRIAGTIAGDVTAESAFNLPVIYTFDSGDPVNIEGVTSQGVTYGSFSLVAGAGFSFDLSEPDRVPRR